MFAFLMPLYGSFSNSFSLIFQLSSTGNLNQIKYEFSAVNLNKHLRHFLLSFGFPFVSFTIINFRFDNDKRTAGGKGFVWLDEGFTNICIITTNVKRAFCGPAAHMQSFTRALPESHRKLMVLAFTFCCCYCCCFVPALKLLLA